MNRHTVALIVLTFLAVLILGAGLLTAPLISPPALAGTAGKALGFAAAHLFLLEGRGIRWPLPMTCVTCKGSGFDPADRATIQANCTGCAWPGWTVQSAGGSTFGHR